jgi:3-phenylpropionate/trans-cinnamate dioxygenase ferredoxin component
MSRWFTLSETPLAINTRKVFIVENKSIIVFNINGEYCAIENQCTHEAFPLEEGDLQGDVITCPFHGAQFCVKTGEVKAPPAFDDLKTYPVQWKGQLLQIMVE